MTLPDIFALSLAVWAVVYHLCFGPLFEWWRARIGIGYDLDEQGRQGERWAVGRLAQFFNCPSCTVLVGVGILIVWWYGGGKPIVYWLAVVGLATLIARWWVSQRVKAEWWR